MAESICRTLRDGGLEGEHAPALTIKDTIRCPLGPFVFDHILSQVCSLILSHKSQSKGIVLVALSRSPIYYEELLKSQGYDVASSSTWIKVLDCYSDLFGWKRKLVENGIIENHATGSSVRGKLCENVEDLEKLSSSIVELGKEMVGDVKGRFVVAIDSVSEMLRLTSLTSVAVILSNLRSHDNVSCLFWLLHSDLHNTGITAALEYMSSMQASIEPMVPFVDEQRGNSGSLSWMEQNLRRGKFCVRFKRRNGRVRMMSFMLRNQASNFHLFRLKMILFLKASCLRSGSIYSCLRRSEMIGQKLSFLLSTRATAKTFKFMMAGNLSMLVKTRSKMLLLGKCRQWILQKVRLSIFVIPMMRCQIQTRIQMTIWTYDEKIVDAYEVVLITIKRIVGPLMKGSAVHWIH